MQTPPIDYSGILLSIQRIDLALANELKDIRKDVNHVDERIQFKLATILSLHLWLNAQICGNNPGGNQLRTMSGCFCSVMSLAAPTKGECC